MERLLKLMEYRSNAGDNRSNADPIFDVKAYQRACESHLFSTSYEHAHNNYKRLSFSEYSSKPKTEEVHMQGMGRLLVKREIRPH